MSKYVPRTSALVVVLCSLGMLFTACSEGSKGGGNGNTATTNGAPKSSNTAPASAVAGGVGGNASGSVESQEIEMDDDVFKPAQLTVPVGAKVTWVNKGKKAHTVVSNDKLFDSGLVNVGGQFAYTFNAPGTYSVHCAPHPKMLGQIIVK
jgi:plastocyanin